MLPVQIVLPPSFDLITADSGSSGLIGFGMVVIIILYYYNINGIMIEILLMITHK